jgi:hypothetical protein
MQWGTCGVGICKRAMFCKLCSTAEWRFKWPSMFAAAIPQYWDALGVCICVAQHIYFSNSLQCDVLLQSFENPKQDTCMAAKHALAQMS